MMNERFELTVSIGDAQNALEVLRNYGLTESEATLIIETESSLAIYEHGIVPKNAVCPELIEMFGQQHIEDALKYTYEYMDYYNMSWPVFKTMLEKMLTIFPPEELITDPEHIKHFISNVLTMAVAPSLIEKIIKGDLLADEFIFGNLLSEISDREAKIMSKSPFESTQSDEIGED